MAKTKKIKYMKLPCLTCGQKIPIDLVVKRLKKEGMPTLAKLLKMIQTP